MSKTLKHKTNRYSSRSRASRPTIPVTRTLHLENGGLGCIETVFKGLNCWGFTTVSKLVLFKWLVEVFKKLQYV